MENARLGIIGLGNRGSVHAAQVAAGKIAHCEPAAVCDVDEAKLQKFDTRLRCTDAGALLGSGRVDAVLIATPYSAHVPLSVAALEAGRHVLVEKPVAVHKADAPHLLAAAAAEESGCRWFIVEQDTCPGDPFDSVARSFDDISAHLCS